VLKYVKNQGYTTQAAPVARAAVPPNGGAPAVPPFDPRKALLGEGIYQKDASDLQRSTNIGATDRDAAIARAKFLYNSPDNPYSNLGEIQRDDQRQQAMIAANRAARGVGISGGTTLARMDLGHDTGRSVFDATNQFNSQVGSANSSFADLANKNRLALGQAVTDSQGRLIENGVGLGGGVGGAPGAPGGLPVAPGSPGLNRGGSFDLGRPGGGYTGNPNAQFAKPFDYGSIKAGYYDATGRRVNSAEDAIRRNDYLARLKLTGRSY
jgi:hypothetical protein